jgi:hypothetical protein
MANVIELAKNLSVGKVTMRMVNENPERGVSDLSITKGQFSTLNVTTRNLEKLAKRSQVLLNLEFSYEDVKQRWFGGSELPAKAPKFFCPIPFREMVIFADGRTSQCCNFFDYENDVIDHVGKKSLKEVWWGKPFENLREGMKSGKLHRRCCFCSLDLIAQRRESHGIPQTG